jgi:hypothetical protein
MGAMLNGLVVFLERVILSLMLYLSNRTLEWEGNRILNLNSSGICHFEGAALSDTHPNQ